MPSKKHILEAKLETVNKQLNHNMWTGIIGIVLVVFVPLVKFENFMLNFSLESIIGFIFFISSVIRGFSLKTKKEDIEAELSVYSKEGKKVKKRKVGTVKNDRI